MIEIAKAILSREDVLNTTIAGLKQSPEPYGEGDIGHRLLLLARTRTADDGISCSKATAEGWSEPDAIEDLLSIASVVPHEWIHGCVALWAMPRPVEICKLQWADFRLAAEYFLFVWAEQASCMGWSTQEIFGCDASGTQGLGLIASLNWDTVVALSQETVILRSEGGHTTVRRRENYGSSPYLLWDLFD